MRNSIQVFFLHSGSSGCQTGINPRTNNIKGKLKGDFEIDNFNNGNSKIRRVDWPAKSR